MEFTEWRNGKETPKSYDVQESAIIQATDATYYDAAFPLLDQYISNKMKIKAKTDAAKDAKTDAAKDAKVPENYSSAKKKVRIRSPPDTCPEAFFCA